jgi:methyltransferase
LSPAVSIAVLTLLAVLLVMAGEAALSAFNERVLRARGAVDSSASGAAGRDENVRLHAWMSWLYPGCFAAMAIEGAVMGPASARVLTAGLALFGLSKALKMWVISTLGVRWTFRILVLPGAPLITRGPYRLMRHPNYLAIIGELIGVAMIVAAPVTGTLAVLGYGALLRRKMAIEDRALGRQ